MDLPKRQLHLVEGSVRDALDRVGHVDPDGVLVVADDGPLGPWCCVAPRELRAQLGTTWAAVVVDAAASGLPDVLGQAQGLVAAGGRLVVAGLVGERAPATSRSRLAVAPFGIDDVSGRLWRRLRSRLGAAAAAADAPATPAVTATGGTTEQAALVETLADTLARRQPTRVVMTADRGRGKSAALGLAIRRARTAAPELRIVAAADGAAAVGELLRFAGDAAPRVVHPLRLARHAMDVDAVVIDEAARLPVPVLDAIVARHPAAVLVFATTVHGYEGTGRGFALRFVPRLAEGPAPLSRHTLSTPIRWAAGDPVERAVRDALLLDASPAVVPRSRVAACDVRYVALDRDALVRDDRRLRAVFGLLVQAHYRTTPRDLEVLLDAPNVSVHVATVDGEVVGVNQVAAEGGLDVEHAERVASGQASLRGHALTESLVRHLGHADAGPLSMARSVRIAVHPDVRRLGVAAGLVAHTHAHHDVDLFGTVFGATPGLLRFRAALGYRLVRLSPARGDRSGEPSVVLVHPFSARARALTERLVADAARDVPAQVDLLVNDHALVADPALADALRATVPPPTSLTDDEVERRVRAWAHGPRTFESCVVPLRAWAAAHPAAITSLAPSDRALVEGRVVHAHPWPRVATAAGLDTPAAAMRRLRRVIRALVNQGGSLTR